MEPLSRNTSQKGEWVYGDERLGGYQCQAPESARVHSSIHRGTRLGCTIERNIAFHNITAQKRKAECSLQQVFGYILF